MENSSTMTVINTGSTLSMIQNCHQASSYWKPSATTATLIHSLSRHTEWSLLHQQLEGVDSNEEILFENLDSGEYIIEVFRFDERQTEYSMSLTLQGDASNQSADQFDNNASNNSQDQATQLGLLTTLQQFQIYPFTMKLIKIS